MAVPANIRYIIVSVCRDTQRKWQAFVFGSVLLRIDLTIVLVGNIIRQNKQARQGVQLIQSSCKNMGEWWLGGLGVPLGAPWVSLGVPWVPLGSPLGSPWVPLGFPLGPHRVPLPG